MFFNSFLIENKRQIKVISIKPGVIATPLWDKSIKENITSMVNCEGYEKEMEFIASNARKNEIKGLNVEEQPDVDTPIGEEIGYHCKTGKHGITPYDWEQYYNFADKIFKNCPLYAIKKTEF
jgi:hypothetical protein